MQQFRKILVGVAVTPDGLEVAYASTRAIQQARRLAARSGASVTLLYSSREEPEPHPLPDQPPHAEVVARAHARLRELRDELGRALPDVDLVFTEDRPWMDLIRAVLRRDADLVIVGRDAGRENERRPMGSVARRLLRKCPAPVWVVHPHHELEHGVMVAATDLTPVGDLATRFAADLSQTHGSELHVVHAYTMGVQIQREMAPLGAEDRVEQIREMEREIETRIRKGLGDLDRPDIRLHIGCTTPWRAINEAVEHLQPQLLVMGTLSRGGVAGLLIGNTAERVVNRVDCSLLTIKPEDFISPVTLE